MFLRSLPKEVKAYVIRRRKQLREDTYILPRVDRDPPRPYAHRLSLIGLIIPHDRGEHPNIRG